MSLGSYILYLRAQKGGITPREVAQELQMPEHYIHAIELEKHAGDVESRTKLATYFDISVDDFTDYARSTHSRFLELLKKERRPQVGFLLMNGETLVGTVDGADSSIIKIVELNTGVKTILQRHAIKKWWPLRSRSRSDDGERRPSANRRPFNNSNNRPMGAGGGSLRAGGTERFGGSSFNKSRPPRPNNYPEPGNERERPTNPFNES